MSISPEQMRVSVILPVKNGERFLEQALDSCVAQSYTPFEIIVIDGHSTDASASIAGNYPQAKYHLQSGATLADAYNQGLEETKGELIAFLSSDDLWMPDKLAIQVRFLRENPEHDMVHGLVVHKLEHGDSLPAGFRHEIIDQEIDAWLLETVLVRRAVFEDVGLFDAAYRSAGDTDWFARARDQGFTSVCLPQVLTHKRVHNQNTSLTDPKAGNQAILRIVRSSLDRKRRGGDK